MNGPLCIGRRETDSLAGRYKCISSRHDSVSSFVFGGEAENQISRRPPSPLPLSRLIVKVPEERAKLHILRKKERTNERVGVFRMSHCLLLFLPSNRQRETARGAARPPTEECPSHKCRLLSVFRHVLYVYYGSLVGGSACYVVHPQGL